MPAEKLRHETIYHVFSSPSSSPRRRDALYSASPQGALARARQVSDDTTLIKADVDAAFRRCPLRPGRRRFAR
eukprot:5780235-Pyramimonas_sp.AAC.1